MHANAVDDDVGADSFDADQLHPVHRRTTCDGDVDGDGGDLLKLPFHVASGEAYVDAYYVGDNAGDGVEAEVACDDNGAGRYSVGVDLMLNNPHHGPVHVLRLNWRKPHMSNFCNRQQRTRHNW